MAGRLVGWVAGWLGGWLAGWVVGHGVPSSLPGATGNLVNPPTACWEPREPSKTQCTPHFPKPASTLAAPRLSAVGALAGALPLRGGSSVGLRWGRLAPDSPPPCVPRRSYSYGRLVPRLAAARGCAAHGNASTAAALAVSLLCQASRPPLLTTVLGCRCRILCSGVPSGAFSPRFQALECVHPHVGRAHQFSVDV